MPGAQTSKHLCCLTNISTGAGGKFEAPGNFVGLLLATKTDGIPRLAFCERLCSVPEFPVAESGVVNAHV